jgi:hypothetical protein
MAGDATFRRFSTPVLEQLLVLSQDPVEVFQRQLFAGVLVLIAVAAAEVASFRDVPLQ